MYAPNKFAVPMLIYNLFSSVVSISDVLQWWVNDGLHFGDYTIHEDNEKSWADYVLTVKHDYDHFDIEQYVPDFSTCFISQNKIRNFQVVCYLKFGTKAISKKLDSDFLKIFEKSLKSSVFWAHCDLASNLNQYIATKYISGGKISRKTRTWSADSWERDSQIHITVSIKTNKI